MKKSKYFGTDAVNEDLTIECVRSIRADLRKDFAPTDINQPWVSDITYIWLGDGFHCLFLITDAHSRKIVGREILKDEFLKHMAVPAENIREVLERIIHIYHTRHPHLSLGMLTPEDKY